MLDNELVLIGEAAQATRLSVKAIRHYESVGLTPKPHRHSVSARTGGNRLYSERDLSRLRFVRQARQLDLGLEEVRRLLAIAEETCPSTHPDYYLILTEHLQAVTRRIDELRDLQCTLTALLSRADAGPACGCSNPRCGCLDAEPPSSTYTGDGSPRSRRSVCSAPSVHEPEPAPLSESGYESHRK